MFTGFRPGSRRFFVPWRRMTPPSAVDTHRGDAGISSPIGMLDRLRLCRFLAQLPTGDLDLLAASATVERLAAGAVLFRSGEAADRFFVVAAGHVALFLGDPGDAAKIATIIGPGETIGEACVCGGGAYPVSALSFVAGELIVIPGAVLCERLCARRETVLAMLSEMSLRLRRLLRQITDLKMKTAAQRLGGYLVERSEITQGPATVQLPYEKKLLANHLGMQPETLSRAQMKLQAVGVRYQKKLNAFAVHDIAVLRSFTQDHPDDD